MDAQPPADFVETAVAGGCPSVQQQIVGFGVAEPASEHVLANCPLRLAGSSIDGQQPVGRRCIDSPLAFVLFHAFGQLVQ